MAFSILSFTPKEKREKEKKSIKGMITSCEAYRYAQGCSPAGGTYDFLLISSSENQERRYLSKSLLTMTKSEIYHQ